MVALRRWISPPARRFLAQTSAALAALAVAVVAHAGAELGVVKVTEAVLTYVGVGVDQRTMFLTAFCQGPTLQNPNLSLYWL